MRNYLLSTVGARREKWGNEMTKIITFSAIVWMALVILIVVGAKASHAGPHPSAPAQPAPPAQCAPYPVVKAMLGQKFHEIEMGVGIIDDNHATVLFATRDGKGWAMFVVAQDTHMACLVAAGTDWLQGIVKPGPEA
jgi:hypothetical protein